ncbi:TPA: DUF1378 family protein [Escherichia coli]
MTFIHIVMLYFCTVICVLYLITGGYKFVRNYVRNKIDAAAAEKLRSGAVASQGNDVTLP